MANTQGFDVVIQASEAVARKALRGAWKSAECPVDPGDEGRIPEYMDIPLPLAIGGYEIEDGQVQIPQEGLDASWVPAIDGAELKLGLAIQLEIHDPPVPSAQLFDMTADVRARVPVGTLPGSQDVGILLDGLPRASVDAALTSAHPLEAKLDTLLDEFIHLVYENGGETPPVEPFIPHVVVQEDVSLGPVVVLDTHTELFDDEGDPQHRIEVDRPDPDTLRISIPIYLRMYDIQSSLVTLEDPMGIETRLEVSAPFESPPGVYRARLSEATVTAGSIEPAGADVSGSTLEGDNYTANESEIPFLDSFIAAELENRGEELAADVGDVEIEVPTEAEIEAAVADIFHEELESRDFIALWTPTAADDEFEVDDLDVDVLPEALVIALNPGAGADVTAITGFIPSGREFAIALSGDTVDDQIDEAIAENGFDDLPKRFEEDGKDVDLNSLDVFLVAGSIRMEGDVTVIDAVADSIDVDADFRVDVGLHWVPDGALGPSGFQELEHHVIGKPEVDPERGLGWIIGLILALISFGAGSVLLAIIIIVAALVVEAIASNIGSDMLVDGVSGAIEGIQAWPSDLSRIGRVRAVFHDNVTPDPEGVLIDATGLVLEGTMDVISSCESTATMAAHSGGTYSTSAASPLLLQAANTHGAASYRWSPGDGSAETAVRDRLHTYTASGIYVAKHALTIEQPGGATSRHFGLVEVRNVPPVVDVGPDVTVEEGEVVTLVGRFHDVEPLDTHESIWIFGDDQPPEPGVVSETHDPPRAEGTSTVEHAWCDDGEYVVLLRVRDQNGGVGTDTRRVTVVNVPPEVDAGPDLYAYPCTAVTLTARFEDPGWCDTHEGWWNFGDCTPDQTAVVEETNVAPAARGTVVASHVYERCGTYHAVCTVVDDDGGVGSDFTVVRVVDVRNAGFEEGFRRLHAGQVARHWSPYGEIAVGPGAAAISGGTGAGGHASFGCEQCVVHGRRRAQRVSLTRPGRAGVRQSVGANPGWEYQVSAWYSIREGAGGTARLGIDPGGGADPDAPGATWTEGEASGDWVQLVRRVVATGDAITIFLEARIPEPEAREEGSGGNEVWFDDVSLVPVQPFCPEEAQEEVPSERCVDFTELQPGTQLPAGYEKKGFGFEALDPRGLRIVAYGAPDGESKLALGRGVLVDLPFEADQVRLEVGLDTRSQVRVLAFDASGEEAGLAETSGDGTARMETLTLTADGIVRLQVGGKGGEETLYRICARKTAGRRSKRRRAALDRRSGGNPPPTRRGR